VKEEIWGRQSNDKQRVTRDRLKDGFVSIKSLPRSFVAHPLPGEHSGIQYLKNFVTFDPKCRQAALLTVRFYYKVSIPGEMWILKKVILIKG
jgi:hypothetical protein